MAVAVEPVMPAGQWPEFSVGVLTAFCRVMKFLDKILLFAGIVLSQIGFFKPSPVLQVYYSKTKTPC